VHRYEKISASDSVPLTGTKTPLAGWKRVETVRAELAAKDQGRAEREGGTCSREEYEKYMANVSCGEIDDRPQLALQCLGLLDELWNHRRRRHRLYILCSLSWLCQLVAGPPGPNLLDRRAGLLHAWAHSARRCLNLRSSIASLV
jgi:hypothetical protein